MEFFAQYQQKIFYAKRALGEMADGNLKELRALANDYRRSQGIFNVFSLNYTN